MKIYKLSAILFMLLGGCTPEVTDWTPAESPKENKVDRTILSYTIHYPAHANAMESGAKKNLSKFLKANIRQPSAVTVILEEYGGHSEKRIKDIERELLKFGIPYELITVESNQDNYHPKRHHQGLSSKHHKKGSGSGVEMIIEKYVVIPPSCGNFSKPLGNAEQSQNSTNFGCADTLNLGMMVANPRDLIMGRPLGASDGTVIAAGVQRYRTDQVKPLIDTSTNEVPANQSSQSNNNGSSTGGNTSGGS